MKIMRLKIIPHQSPIQKTAKLSYPQFNRTQRKISTLYPFTDCVNQVQNDSTVANRSNRSNDPTFMLNTITKTVPILSKHPWLH